MSDILIVDDERDIRELISDILEDEGFVTRLAGNSDEAISAINAEPPALMILDIWLKDSRMDGIDILKTVKRDNPDVPVVIISGHGNIEIAVAAIKQGAYDFIEKPFNIDQLMVVIRRAMETSRLRRENHSLKRREVASTDMIGSSTAFKTLDGAAGQGHQIQWSGDAARPGGGGQRDRRALYPRQFQPCQCGPFRDGELRQCRTPDRMEEVLFGRETPERGVEAGLAGTGAWRGDLSLTRWRIMPLGTQSKILRVLVDQQFTRVGGNDKVRVDLRVISFSTNKDLGRRD